MEKEEKEEEEWKTEEKVEMREKEDRVGEIIARRKRNSKRRKNENS